MTHGGSHMKKTLTALAIAGSLTFLGAGAAQALPYPAPSNGGEVTDATPAAGQTFTFTATGFIPGETVTITITLVSEPTAASVGGLGVGGGLGAGVSGLIVPSTVVQELSPTADEEGTIAIPVNLTEPGTYEILAVGQESGVEASAVVEVVAASAAGGTDNGVGGGAANGGASADDEAAVANGDSLANTGLESSALLWGGAGILALGAGATAVVVARRKTA
jgi:LPXTG-motif cell wall-anchored protein